MAGAAGCPREHHFAGFAPVGIVVLRDLDGTKYSENFGKAIVLVFFNGI